MIIYGAGNTGRYAIFYYNREDIKYFVDTYKSGTMDGYLIKNIHSLMDEEKNEKIVICSYAWKQIAEELEKLGFTNVFVFRVMTNILKLDFETYMINGTDQDDEKIVEKICSERNKIRVREWRENGVKINIGDKITETSPYNQKTKHGYLHIVEEKYSEFKRKNLKKGKRIKLYYGQGGVNNPLYYVFDNESDDCLVQSLKDDTDICANLNGLLDFLKTEKGTLLDIGANIGAFALTFASEGYNVIAIEAGKKNCECLSMANDINHFNIDIIEKAIWNTSGSLFFNEQGVDGFASETGTGEKVESICLDDLEKYTAQPVQEVCFIKLDVEGAEIKTIQGGKQFLKRIKYPPILCESNKVTLLRNGESVSELFYEFGNIGYIPYIPEEGRLRKVNTSEIQHRTVQDYLFVYKDDARIKEENLLEPMDEENIVTILKTEMSTMPDDYVKATKESISHFPKYKNLIG